MDKIVIDFDINDFPEFIYGDGMKNPDTIAEEIESEVIKHFNLTQDILNGVSIIPNIDETDALVCGFELKTSRKVKDVWYVQYSYAWSAK